MKIIKVSDKGQVAIPRAFQDSFGIKTGDELVIVQVGNKLVLEKAQKISEQIKDDFKDIIKFNEMSLKKVWDNKEDEIWNTYLDK
jgi:AbrB family looped-hinge helix DNA binding protein